MIVIKLGAVVKARITVRRNNDSTCFRVRLLNIERILPAPVKKGKVDDTKNYTY